MKFTKISFTSIFKVKRYEWKFGSRSRQKLEGVNKDLVDVCHLALSYSPVDFGITCGLRTQAEQNQLRIQGKSHVKHSRHQDGMAVDVVAYVDGSVSWDIEHYITIAEAFCKASKELNVEIRWGGAWTHPLIRYSGREAYESYIDLRKAQGKKVFIDGPHFEIPK